MAWVYLYLGVFVSIFANYYIKESNGLSNLNYSILGIVTATVALVLYATALKTLPLVIAYIVWTGVGTLAIALLGILYMKEAVTPIEILFMVLIVVGAIGLQVSHKGGS